IVLNVTQCGTHCTNPFFPATYITHSSGSLPRISGWTYRTNIQWALRLIMSQSIVIVTVTDYTFVVPPTATSATNTSSVTTSIGTTISSLSTLSSSFTTSSQPSTSSEPIPPAPVADPHAEPPNNTIVYLFLTFVVLSILFLIGLFGLVCFQNHRGRCPSCKSLEDKIRRLETNIAKNAIVTDRANVAKPLSCRIRSSVFRHRKTALADLEKGPDTTSGPQLSRAEMSKTLWPNGLMTSTPRDTMESQNGVNEDDQAEPLTPWPRGISFKPWQKSTTARQAHVGTDRSNPYGYWRETTEMPQRFVNNSYGRVSHCAPYEEVAFAAARLHGTPLAESSDENKDDAVKYVKRN
ncbi:hypothetical protein BU24DRAFT_481644, partial [Aaosphaeria arxii CBS 175.79]